MGENISDTEILDCTEKGNRVFDCFKLFACKNCAMSLKCHPVSNILLYTDKKLYEAESRKISRLLTNNARVTQKR